MHNSFWKQSQRFLLLHQKYSKNEHPKLFGMNRKIIKCWIVNLVLNEVELIHIKSGRRIKTDLKSYEKNVSYQVELYFRN